MDKHAGYRLEATLLALILLLSIGHQANSHSTVNSSDVSASNPDIKQIVKSLEAGNVTMFARFCSAKGVYVVRRSLDWEQSYPLEGRLGPYKEKNTDLLNDDNSDSPYLNFEGAPALVTEEVTLKFSRSEIQNMRFAAIFQKFRRYASVSRRNFGGLDWSPHVTDNFSHYRYLGPAGEGKLASNVFWYITLIQENKHWKVRSLEYVVW